MAKVFSPIFKNAHTHLHVPAIYRSMRCSSLCSSYRAKRLSKLSHCVIWGYLFTSISNLLLAVGDMNNATARIAVPLQKCITGKSQKYHTETDRGYLNKLTLAGHFVRQRHRRYLISVSFRTIIQPEKQSNWSLLISNEFILMQEGVSHAGVIDPVSLLGARGVDANINKPKT